MEDSLKIVASPWFKDEVRALAQEQRDRIDRKLRDFRNKGWRAAVGDESVKHLADGIYEFRVLGRGTAFRLLFFLVPGQVPRLVILTTCAAKSQVAKRQRLETEIERARLRRAAWMEQIKKEEEEDGR